MRKFFALAATIGAAIGLAACAPEEETVEAPAEPVVEAPVDTATTVSTDDTQAMDGMEEDGMATEAADEDDERGNPVDQAN